MMPDSQTPGNVESRAPVCRREPIVIGIIGALDGLVHDPALKNAVAFLVPLDDNAGKAVRINITARQKQIEEIDRRA